MKKTITLVFLGLIFGSAAVAQTILFSQDFNSSTTIGDYVNVAGEANKFTAISATSGDNPISAANNTVRYTKTANSTGYFSRNVNLAVTAPKVLQFEFDFQVLAGSVAGTTQAQMYVGSGFGNTATVPTGSQAHSKVVFDFGNANNFSVKSSTAPTTPSSLYSTQQKLTWVINNSGTTITYTAPDGITTKTLTNDKWDLYVGAGSSSPVLGDRDGLAGGIGNDLQNFYFTYSSGSENSTLELDNLVIKDLSAVLPVNLVSFSGKAAASQNQLQWTTAGEKDNAHFDVLRSADGQNFVKIAELAGNGTCSELKQYRYTDSKPGLGLQYYQLKQVDFNGNSTLSALISIQNDFAANSLEVSQSTDGWLQVGAQLAKNTGATLSISNANGQVLYSSSLVLNAGKNAISVPFDGAKGLYLVSLQLDGGQRMVAKFIR
jgi:hypothetical protein